MEIIGVLVGNKDLPKTCLACDLISIDTGWGVWFCPFQQYADEEITIDYYDKLASKNERPNWCPLTDSVALLTVDVMNELVIHEVVEKKK